MTDAAELLLGSDTFAPDTDGDGLLDGSDANPLRGILYRHADHLGSSLVVSYADSTQTDRALYRPFGEAVEPAPTGEEFGFTGQRLEADFGIYDYGARWYDPALGRFLQPDPIVGSPFDPQNLNRYSYVRNDPGNRVDPTGLLFQDAIPGGKNQTNPNIPDQSFLPRDVDIGDVHLGNSRVNNSSERDSNSILVINGPPAKLIQGESQGNDGGRPLTANEIAEARKAYGDQIDYSKPRVFGEKYFPFQGAETAMAPDGNIYFPLAKGCADLTACSIPVPGKPGAQYDILGTFIHEMGHVMQHQQGVNVLGRGFLLQAGRILSGGLYNPYSYPAGANPSQLNIEAQAQYYRDQYCAANPGC